MAKDKFWDFYEDGITQSCYRKFLQCRMQFYLEYVEGWSSDHENIWFSFGKCFHYILEQAYKNYRPPIRDEIEEWLAQYRAKLAAGRDRPISLGKAKEYELIFALVEAMAPLYFANYSSDFGNDWNNLATEQVFKIPYNQTHLNGCLDHIFEDFNGSIYFRDHKCLSVIGNDLDIADSLELDPQINIYSIALEHIWGKLPHTVWLNIIRRPRDLPKAGVSIPDYCRKIQKDVMGDLSHWFKRIPYTLSEDGHYEWRMKYLVPVINDMERWVNEGFPRYANLEAKESKYGKCALYGLIFNNNEAGYYKRKHVFQELV